MFDVIILAGSGKETELTSVENVSNKAFISIHGRPMLAYVIEAFKKSNQVNRIAVVGPVADLTPFIEEYGILAVPQGVTIPENLQKGIDAIQPREHFLISSADVPFLTPEAINNLLELCKPYDLDFYYPIVTKADNDTRFPGVERTYVNLRDGVFTGGNLFLANPGAMERALPRLDHFFSLRKSPLKLAATLGPGFLLKLLTKRLSLAQLEARFSALFGLNGKAVTSRYPEIGTDVDKPTDLALARDEINSKV